MDKGDFNIKKQTFISKNEKAFKEVYKIDKNPMGSGAFGVVSKCQHRVNGFTRACKKVSKKKIKNMEKFKQEIEIL